MSRDVEATPRRADRRRFPRRGSPTWNRLAAQVLRPDEMKALLAACVRNAQKLASEGQTLLDAGSTARAYVLAGTALEETGKAMELFAMYFAPPLGVTLDEEAWVKFWCRWYSHESKTEGGVLIEQIVGHGIRDWSHIEEPPPSTVMVDMARGLIAEIEQSRLNEQGAEWGVSRQRALYVDWSGQVDEPDALVSRDEASEMLKRSTFASTSMGYMVQAFEMIEAEPDAMAWFASLMADLKKAFG